MYHEFEVLSGTGAAKRKIARYRLASLLMNGRFEEAGRLADQWLKEQIILAEDHAFVAGILEGASRRAPRQVPFPPRDLLTHQ